MVVYFYPVAGFKYRGFKFLSPHFLSSYFIRLILNTKARLQPFSSFLGFKERSGITQASRGHVKGSSPKGPRGPAENRTKGWASKAAFGPFQKKWRHQIHCIPHTLIFKNRNNKRIILTIRGFCGTSWKLDKGLVPRHGPLGHTCFPKQKKTWVPKSNVNHI